MAQPAVLTMISGVSSPTVSNTFVNNNAEICALQISGTFSSATVKVEGIVDINSGKWVSLATFDLTDLDLKTNGMSDKSLYRVGIAGILRVRISLTAINGGDITVMANFVGTEFYGKELPPSSEAPFTAYDLAVLGGYTGTQADYEAALADIVEAVPLSRQMAANAQAAAERAASSATYVKNYAVSASNSASNAGISATNAAESAADAASSASAASGSATAAANSATRASNSAANAENSAVNASVSSSNAAVSASNAATSASGAANSASNASSSAANASNSAASAANSAFDAAGSATSAATSATAAQNAVGAIAPAIVTEWLNENVNPAGSAVVVDSSLTVSGAAADAKVTGDKITVLADAAAELDRTLFKVPYTPSNMSVDSNGKIYLDKGFVNQTTGYSSATSTTSPVYGKYYRTQAGSGGANSFLQIGDKALLVTLDLDWVQWTCFSYSGTTNGSATHTNSQGKYISGTEAIFIPKNSTDTRFSLGFRGIGDGDSNRPVFTDEQVNAIKAAIKFFVLTDNSLSIIGSPADAEATGNAINELENAFNTTLKSSAWTPTVYKGQYIGSENGVVVDNQSSTALMMARTDLWNGYGYKIAVNLNNADYEYRVMYYDENGSLSEPAGSNGFLGCSAFASGLQYIPSNAIRFALSIRRKDQAVMTDEYVAEITAALSAYTSTDTTLTERGISADAKAVGDALNYSNAALGNIKDTQYLTVKSPTTSGNWNFNDGGIYIATGNAFTSGKYVRLASSGGNLYPLRYKRMLFTLGLSDYYWTAWTYSGATWGTGARNLTGSAYVSGLQPIPFTYQDGDLNFSICVCRRDEADLTDTDKTTILNALKILRPCSNRSEKILFFGDSITRGRIGGENANARWPIPNQIAEELGIVCANYGIGNMGWIAGWTSSNTDKTNAFGYLKRISDSNYFSFTDGYAGYHFIDGGNWNDFNTIVFALGVNDSSYAVGKLSDLDGANSLSYSEVMAWGTSAQNSSSANRTIAKAVYQCVRYIRDSETEHAEGDPYVPGGRFKNIVILGPITGVASKYRQTLCEFYADFCDKYGCTFVSTYDAPIPDSGRSVYLPDDVHPNQSTYDLLSRYLAGKIGGLSSNQRDAAKIRALETYDGTDILRNIASYSTSTSNGITFTWNYPSCTVSGTRGSSQAIYSLYDTRVALPNGIAPGDRFLLRYGASLESVNMKWYIFLWNADGHTWNFSTNSWSSGTSSNYSNYLSWPIKIPDGTVGMTVQIRVASSSSSVSFDETVNRLQLVKIPKQKMMAGPLLVSFVDDDTSGYEYVRKYREACRHNGVFGNYAVLTRYSEDDYSGSGWTGPEMRARLLSYEDDGFGMLIHAWRQSSDDPWQSMGSDEAKIAQCRAVLLKGLREMRQFGFANYNYWVTPYGVRGSGPRRIAAEAGVNCLISTNNGRHNSMQDFQNTFIKRVALYKDDTRPNGVANAMEDVKAAIDAAAFDGAGWLIITTHFNEWGSLIWDSTLDSNGYEIGYARFNEMVQYALDAGLTPMTVPRAWTYYSSILETNLDIMQKLDGNQLP